jgi:hypothetical protein
VGRAKLCIAGKQAAIDSRINNNCIVCAPTSYQSPAGLLSYAWLTELAPAAQLPALPTWLIADLNTRKRPLPVEEHGLVKRPRPADRELQVITDDHFTICQPLLHEAGFRQTRLTRVKTDGFDFVADRTCVCPLCQNRHGHG